MRLIVDGLNTLHRVQWSNQKTQLQTSKGEDVGCQFKFLRSLFALVKRFKPTGFYVVWDKQETSNNYRTTMTGGTYKAQRLKPNEDLIVNNKTKLVPVIEWLGGHNFFSKILEADDIIAWLVNKLKKDEMVVVVSCDRDFFQLVQPNVQIFNPIKQQLYTIENFERLIGIKPKDYLQYKAMVGDPADNLKRKELNGIGPKTAIKVIKGQRGLTVEQKQAIDDLIHLMSLEQGFKSHPEEADYCKEQFEHISEHVANFDAFREYCEQNEFKSILNTFDQWKLSFQPNRLVDIINSLVNK